MGEDFAVILLIVFATHLPLFAWRWWRTGERRHAATTLTFSLLVITYALRIFAPGLEVAGLPAWWLVRVPAWACAALSLSLLARHWFASGRDFVGRLS
ncbi:MAG: hypothetical protein QF890_17660 [Myxococcota bacterium]|nr:hypothetical protein [Deltaproteobacteria bacterium]MCP4243555.1 hypothetical protein [bacterium]MDP6073496.1 hypothetical protein [Myxococcota bacterium]MDP6244666.1 hypothetical protein [Myxococcota bacterium]MDP7076129.1 hypothetical protein [Myxococcota bacterium]